MEYDAWVWAKTKPFCSLYSHMTSVGACMQAYLRAPSSAGLLKRLARWLGLTPEMTIRTLAYVASLHDIGKAHPDFVFRYEPALLAWRKAYPARDWGSGNAAFRHEIYGAMAVKRIWHSGTPPFLKNAQRIFIAALRLHHQGKSAEKPTKFVPGEWLAIQDDLERRMREQFQPEKHSPEPENADALGILLTALLVLCDWVASSRRFGVFEGEGDAGCLAWARERADRVLREYGLVSDKACAFAHPAGFCQMWPEIPENGVRPLQRCCEELGEALLTIIEAPMGEGKTEAALYLVGRLCEWMHRSGIYMALPTAATSNQMVERVRALLKRHGGGDVRLLHSSAWMLDELSPEAGDMSVEEGDLASALAWLRPLRRAMLSENAVGTVDQAMAAVLRLRYGMLRLAGLADKVLIIDEIHAYDEYMSRILQRLLAWCRALEIPVILLSATLQQRQKARYLGCFGAELPDEADYPLITQVDLDGRVHCTHVPGSAMRRRYRFCARPILGDAEATARLAAEKVRGGGCVCVMLNTVRQAQAVYRALRAECGADVILRPAPPSGGDGRCILFHARYKMKRRAQIERRCLDLFGRDGARPEKMILVCTQVVEQSLDVDFDLMITELAPVDLLLQRAGREQRHDRKRPAGLAQAQIIVLTPAAEASGDAERRYGASGAVYAPCVLWSTEKWLGEGRDVRVPEDMRACVEQVYGDFDENALESFVRRQVREEAERAEADGCVYPAPTQDDFFGAVPSNRHCFAMDEPEEMDMGSLFRKPSAAKTRLGADSVRIAFLPRDFSEEGDEKEVYKRTLLESCSLPLTRELKEAIMDYTNQNPKDHTGTITADNLIRLREDEDGIYKLGRLVLHADDDLGIWWE